MTRLKFLKTSVSAIVATAGLATGALAQDDPLSISYVVALTTVEWTNEIKAGAEAAAKDLDFPVTLKFSGPSSFDPGRQASIFMNEVQTSPDAIVITNVAAPLFIQPVLSAQENGQMVTWSNTAPSSEFYDGFFVSADPTTAGEETADVLAKALEEKLGTPAAEIEGAVVLGICLPGLAILENRIKGLRAGLETRMPNVSVLPTIPTKPDREGSFAVWNQAIRANSDALAFVDACEAGNLNVNRIIADDQLDAFGMSFDVPGEVRAAVQDGSFLAASSSNFFMQGYMATYATAMALHNEEPLPEGWLKIPSTLVVQDNAEAYNAAWDEIGDGGLRNYYADEIDAAIADLEAGNFSPIGEYDNPPS